MTLIKSISGIRGTIGGSTGEGLNPLDIVKFTSAYATLIRKTCTVKSNKIVVGRDARLSGEMVKNVVVGTLMGMGWDVVDIDLASTPTTELAVTMEGASGGIILTASHNPKQWNALKLLNEKGEFLNKEEGNEVLRIAEAEAFEYAEVDKLGITDFTPQQVTHYVFESARERELVFTYKTVYDGPVTPSDELDGGRFWPVEEIRANLGKGIFTPNFEGEVEKVLS